MLSRKEKHNKKGTKKTAKFLVGTLFLSAGIISSINVAFADQDIEAMLINWFNKQKTNSIESIEQAVMTEKETQLKRLKEELQLEIKEAEQELNAFTEAEKEKRVKNLQIYTDELIKNYKIDNFEEKSNITSELDLILQQAKEKMDQAVKQENNDAGN